VRNLLVLLVNYFPFLLKLGYQFFALLVRQQELLFVSFIFLFDLHLADQLVLVFNLVLDFLQVFRTLAVRTFFQKVFVFINGQFGSLKLRAILTCENVLDSIGNYVILV